MDAYVLCFCVPISLLMHNSRGISVYVVYLSLSRIIHMNGYIPLFFTSISMIVQSSISIIHMDDSACYVHTSRVGEYASFFSKNLS